MLINGYVSHFFSFLIWSTLSVYFGNVDTIWLKISIKLLHILSYLCKQFFPVPCIHNPNTLWYAVIFFQKAKFLYLKRDCLPYIHFCNHFCTFSSLDLPFLSRMLGFLWKIRYWTHQSWNIFLNGKLIIPMANILIFCVA